MEATKKKRNMATMTLTIPNSDVSLFTLMAERMGWVLQGEPTKQPKAAKKRRQTIDYFIDLFRTDEITEEEILAECDAVRQEMYEKGLQTG